MPDRTGPPREDASVGTAGAGPGQARAAGPVAADAPVPRAARSTVTGEEVVTVRVRLFAMHRELAGTRTVELRLASGADVASAWDALAVRFPALAAGRASVRFAVNGAYVDPDQALADGDELAVIPPVSGGGDAEEEGPPMRLLALQEDPFPPGLVEELTRRLVTAHDGAAVAFLGVTRRTPGRPAPGQEAATIDGPIESLEYEALEPMVLAVLGAIADEVEARHQVRRLAIVHRTGEVPLGEPSVAVVAVAPHRDAAFAAARYAIDETKARAPIWKAERSATGHVWVGEAARTGPLATEAASGDADRGEGAGAGDAGEAVADR